MKMMTPVHSVLTTHLPPFLIDLGVVSSRRLYSLHKSTSDFSFSFFYLLSTIRLNFQLLFVLSFSSSFYTFYILIYCLLVLLCFLFFSLHLFHLFNVLSFIILFFLILGVAVADSISIQTHHHMVHIR